MSKFAQLVFEGGLDAEGEAEASIRGYRSHVWVELDDGSRVPITFYDLTRLTQTLTNECAAGRNFFAEPNLVILPDVTRANMEAAARALADEDFFRLTAATHAPGR